ncbi:hypothetical protein PWR63_09600 [Paraburkholderia sp. A2WS-5]|uniref:hypothetical protein n=1 Tax=unclassified Paraburkholderia TaxID=2615204 RepID=UPI003B79A99A
MERLARLLPFRQFGRLRHLRGIASCAMREARASAAALGRQCGYQINGSLFDDIEQEDEARPLPSAQPAFARVSLNSTLNAEQPDRRAPVRVYHGQSRLIMVGTMEAVCRAIDRCIAEQQADAPVALAK